MGGRNRRRVDLPLWLGGNPGLKVNSGGERLLAAADCKDGHARTDKRKLCAIGAGNDNPSV